MVKTIVIAWIVLGIVSLRQVYQAERETPGTSFGTPFPQKCARSTARARKTLWSWMLFAIGGILTTLLPAGHSDVTVFTVALVLTAALTAPVNVVRLVAQRHVRRERRAIGVR